MNFRRGGKEDVIAGSLTAGKNSRNRSVKFRRKSLFRKIGVNFAAKTGVSRSLGVKAGVK